LTIIIKSDNGLFKWIILNRQGSLVKNPGWLDNLKAPISNLQKLSQEMPSDKLSLNGNCKDVFYVAIPNANQHWKLITLAAKIKKYQRLEP